MSCRETNRSRDIFIHICIIDFSIRYAQSQSACRLSDSERNDNEVLFSQPLFNFSVTKSMTKSLRK